jgi:hypothetical protein
VLRDLIICHDSAFPVADTRHKQDDATVASHSPARQSAGICTATPPDELSPDNEVADTITPAARPPLPDTMNGLPIHPYVPLWAAVFAVSLWGNGDHGERGGIGLKISPRGTHRYTA